MLTFRPTPFWIALCAILMAAHSRVEAQEAVLFEDGLISTADRGEAFPFFAPDGTQLFFSTHNSEWSFHTLYVTSRESDSWTEAELLPFSGKYSDRAPRLSPDGRSLYFSSNRFLKGHPQGDYNIWVVRRATHGSWGEPEALPETVNTPAHEYHAVITRKGELFFSRVTDPERDAHDIFVSVRGEGGFSEAVKVGPPISDGHSQPDIFVAPDGDFMILVITDGPQSHGGDDLYVSYRHDGDWTVPMNLGPRVNTEGYDYGPSVSPDGRLLMYTRHDRGLGDIYAVLVEDLDLDI